MVWGIVINQKHIVHVFNFSVILLVDTGKLLTFESFKIFYRLMVIIQHKII